VTKVLHSMGRPYRIYFFGYNAHVCITYKQ